jgi:hypothetical protein
MTGLNRFSPYSYSISRCTLWQINGTMFTKVTSRIYLSLHCTYCFKSIHNRSQYILKRSVKVYIQNVLFHLNRQIHKYSHLNVLHCYFNRDSLNSYTKTRLKSLNTIQFYIIYRSSKIVTCIWTRCSILVVIINIYVHIYACTIECVIMAQFPYSSYASRGNIDICVCINCLKL